MSQSFEVRCLTCGATVTLKQPDDHSKYTPAGKCPKCGLFHYATWTPANGVQVNASTLDQNVKR